MHENITVTPNIPISVYPRDTLHNMNVIVWMSGMHDEITVTMNFFIRMTSL